MAFSCEGSTDWIACSEQTLALNQSAAMGALSSAAECEKALNLSVCLKDASVCVCVCVCVSLCVCVCLCEIRAETYSWMLVALPVQGTQKSSSKMPSLNSTKAQVGRFSVIQMEVYENKRPRI